MVRTRVIREIERSSYCTYDASWCRANASPMLSGFAGDSRQSRPSFFFSFPFFFSFSRQGAPMTFTGLLIITASPLLTSMVTALGPLAPYSPKRLVRRPSEPVSEVRGFLFPCPFSMRVRHRACTGPRFRRASPNCTTPWPAWGNSTMRWRARALAHTWGSHHVRTLSSYKSDRCSRLCSFVKQPRPSSHAPTSLIPILPPAELSFSPLRISLPRDVPTHLDTVCIAVPHPSYPCCTHTSH